MFPGCDAPPSACEAHHVVPWQQGGPTALWNLVLLCHPHHPTVEPARHSLRDQWQVRIAPDGYPEHLPPARLDPTRTPIRHHRHQNTTAHDTGPPTAA
ncbi:MAG: HNH endonuclease [Actinobacteria bacterium]|nr:HNH endonuclease [Actinomycetota bacterium]